MLISDSHKFVFVHVPKCGGDSVTAALRPYAVEQSGEHSTGDTKHSTARRIRREYFAENPNRHWQGFTSFAVVRNPWEQVHSDYWFCRNSSVPGHELGSWRDKVIRCKEIDFAEFVVDICGAHGRSGPGFFNHYLTDEAGRQMVTEILRHETLGADWAAICEKIGLPGLELPRINVTAKRPDYRDGYDGRSRFLVGRRFEDDVERFGYTFEGVR